MMRHYRSRCAGTILILALIALFVLMILSLASLDIATQSIMRAGNKRQAQVARNLAEGGLRPRRGLAT